MSDLTQILERVESGDAKAADELLPLVYEELRRLAAHKMSLQPPGQTLQATALVHEAYLRLLGNEEKRWESRRHFFRAAAEAMRHILIDRARRRLRAKHGEKAENVPLDDVEIAAPANDEIVLQLDEALETLAEISLGVEIREKKKTEKTSLFPIAVARWLNSELRAVGPRHRGGQGLVLWFGCLRNVALSAVLRHRLAVNTAAIPSDAPVEPPASVTAATLKLVRTWVASCNDFRERERREIIEQVPSPKRLAEYREELKWMIRGARALLNLVSDPEFPARQFMAEMSGKLLQLEDSWQSLNNPITDADADAILRKAFPDEAGA